MSNDMTLLGSPLTQGRLRVLALMLADAFCLFATWALLVCGYKAAGFGEYDTLAYFRLWPVLAIFVGVNATCRLYHGNWMYPAMPLSPVEEFRRLFASSVFTHLLLMSVLGFTRHNADYSRFIIGAGGVLVGVFAQSFRNLVRLALFKLHIGQIPVALVRHRGYGVAKLLGLAHALLRRELDEIAAFFLFQLAHGSCNEPGA